MTSPLTPESPAPEVRQLTESDWALYRELRLEALRSEPGVYSSSYALESGEPDHFWRERLSSSTSATFLLSAGADPLGITSVFTPDGIHAHFVATYIRPEFRGRRFSHYLYEARIAWARRAGCRVAVISARASNLPSQRANARFGFKLTHREPKVWPDGGREDEIHHELIL